MKMLSDSVRTRTILVLLVGLTISHVGSTLVYSSDRDQAMTAAKEQMIGDKLAALAQLIDTSAAPSRQQVVAAISNPGMQITWTAADEMPAGHLEDAQFEPLQRSLQPYFGQLGPDRLHVVAASAQQAAAAEALGAARLTHGFTADQRLLVSIKLHDASWVTFNLGAAAVSPRSRSAILSTLVMVIGTLVISIWATGWITAPLAAFACAAERLGLDVTAPPLPESGPKEVRVAARAFNRMQQRVRNFVEDRLQMLAAISHDLRTPITRLRLRTEQLPIASEPQSKMLADLDEMEQMVSSSLAFAKDEAADEPSQAIDLSALLEAICDQSTDAGQDAQFVWASRLIYRGRPLAIKRLFSNLVQNAVRYGNCARVSALRAGDFIAVAVEDEGPGIPPEQLEAVFKPFYRLEQSRNKRTGGTGLGLANARTIARAHGGDVTLENRPTGGLRALVTLPCGGDPLGRTGL